MIYAASTEFNTLGTLRAVQPRQGCEAESSSGISSKHNTWLLAEDLICWAALEKISLFLIFNRGTGWLSDHYQKAPLPSMSLRVSIQMHLYYNTMLSAQKLRWKYYFFYFLQMLTFLMKKSKEKEKKNKKNKKQEHLCDILSPHYVIFCPHKRTPCNFGVFSQLTSTLLAR